MSALYNEIEPFAVDWLRNLERAGHIAPGAVESRSVADLSPADVAGATQAHFFAGIGVWSYALRLAGWPDDAPVWTGSCPCQPFSPAGAGGGFSDPRHLWPDWFRLIRECRPPVVFGEQTESPAGRAWLDLVSADMEGIGYAFGAAVLPAASVGAPHARHRLYFVAHALSEGRASWRPGTGSGPPARRGGAGGMADHDEAGRGGCATGRLHDQGAPRPDANGRGAAGHVGDAHSIATRRNAGTAFGAEAAGAGAGFDDRSVDHEPQPPGPTNGFWADAEWHACRDGKWRPAEPGTLPLVDESAPRVGELSAYGNAIVAEVAATFIRAFLEAA